MSLECGRYELHSRGGDSTEQQKQHKRGTERNIERENIKRNAHTQVATGSGLVNRVHQPTSTAVASSLCLRSLANCTPVMPIPGETQSESVRTKAHTKHQMGQLTSPINDGIISAKPNQKKRTSLFVVQTGIVERIPT